jgi:hypothetical protein
VRIVKKILENVAMTYCEVTMNILLVTRIDQEINFHSILFLLVKNDSSLNDQHWGKGSLNYGNFIIINYKRMNKILLTFQIMFYEKFNYSLKITPYHPKIVCKI